MYAVALSRPGPVSFELSPAVRFDENGAPKRIWTPVYSEDGVVVVDLGSDVDPVVTVRASGPGVFPVPELVRVARSRLARSRRGRCWRSRESTAPGYHGPDPELLVAGLRESAVASVAELGTARLRVLWSGAPWKQRRLALVLVTRPDGTPAAGADRAAG